MIYLFFIYIKYDNYVKVEWNQVFIQHKHDSDMEVYTDESKMQNEVGSACIIIEKEAIETIIARKLPHQASVYNCIQLNLQQSS